MRCGEEYGHDLVDLGKHLIRLQSDGIPQVYRGACASERAHVRWGDEDGLDYLACLCGDAVVQAMDSDSNTFKGDLGSQNLQTYKFADFLDHLRDESAECVYLAQAAIQEAGTPTDLGPILSDFHVPTLNSSHPASANLWMSARKTTTSSLHYDCYDNLLCCIVGRKQVNLLPTSVSRELSSFAPWSESANHSNVDSFAEDFFGHPDMLTAHLDAGDVLFIPEGYWHQVRSSACSVAINIWYTSKDTERLLDPAKRQYFLRRLLREEVEAKKMQLLSETPQSDTILQASVGAAPNGAVRKVLRLSMLGALQPPTAAALRAELKALSGRQVMALRVLLEGRDCINSEEISRLMKTLSTQEVLPVLAWLARQHQASFKDLMLGLDGRAMAHLVQHFEDATGIEELGPKLPEMFESIWQVFDGPSRTAFMEHMTSMVDSFGLQALRGLTEETLSGCRNTETESLATSGVKKRPRLSA